MVLSRLPPEIVLYLLSYLPISSLSQLYSVSRTWNTFLLHHEATIYHRAAFLHGFIDGDSASLESVKSSNKYSERVLADVDSWKKLCEIRIRVRNAWNGVAPSEKRPVPAGPLDFTALRNTHRIKVDEKRGLIMTTTRWDTPKVLVRDMITGTMLWLLEPSMGRPFAHLEYSEGFLIFDRDTGDREVWRLTDSALRNTVHAVPCPEVPVDFEQSSRPDSAMLRDSQIALRKVLSRLDFEPTADYRSRGCFEPYALLHAPEETRAYRFVYPTLLTAAQDKVYLWDLPSARIVEVVQGIQRATVSEQPSEPPKVDTFFDAHETFGAEAQNQEDGDMSETQNMNIELYFDDGDEEDDEEDEDDENESDEDGDVPSDLTRLRSIRYVDHSPTHIFLAGQHVLKIFCRASTAEEGDVEVGGNSRNSNTSHLLAFALTSTKFRYGRWKYTIRPGSGKQEVGSCLVRYEFDVHDGDINLAGNLYDQFQAVHVSPCGSHFVALLGGSRILIVPHFRKLVGQPEEAIYNAILDVQLSSPYSTRSVYLAYEGGDAGEGRVGVVTSGAVFIVTLPQFPLNDRTNTPPSLRVSRVKDWTSKQELDHVSCLMLSDTRLFVNYNVSLSAVPEWDESFERGLEDLQTLGNGYYTQALFVRDLVTPPGFGRHDSTVHEVNMLP